jgi:hypothetical protein
VSGMEKKSSDRMLARGRGREREREEGRGGEVT